jgi:exo-beta-1,3-glucanase (GH17 family)
MKTFPGGLLIAAVLAILAFGVWSFVNRPIVEPSWPRHIQGFAFSPFSANGDPTRHDLPTREEIDSDLKVLAGKVSALRTYGAADAAVPELAERYGMNVVVGAWIGPHAEQNEKEIATAIELARTRPNVARVFIGNEVVLRGDIPIEQLEKYLDRAREAILQPVGTAEPWQVWLSHPELAQHVTFIGVHLFPYWEGVSLDQAVDFSFAEFHRVQRAFPGKEVVVAEIGWPSRGPTRGSAVASARNQATFLRRFLRRAEMEHLTYYVMEAFDQPWKAQREGAVGSDWGVYDVNRHLKPGFTGCCAQ